MTNPFLLYQTFCELFPKTPITEEECEKFFQLLEAHRKMEADFEERLRDDLTNDLGDHYDS